VIARFGWWLATATVEGLVWLAEVLEARRLAKSDEAASRDAQGY
jgi:hypothetical protein